MAARPDTFRRVHTQPLPPPATTSPLALPACLGWDGTPVYSNEAPCLPLTPVSLSVSLSWGPSTSFTHWPSFLHSTTAIDASPVIMFPMWLLVYHQGANMWTRRVAAAADDALQPAHRYLLAPLTFHLTAVYLMPLPADFKDAAWLRRWDVYWTFH